VDFVCPEEFGYFPHPSDCSQYYVCVFGGALLESCTGGLMYSNELQTCDWPRNVNQCNGTGAVLSQNNIQSVAVAAPAVGRVRSTTQSSSQQTTSDRYAYKPIKIESYGDLRDAIAGNQQNEEYLQSGRAGRSYAQEIPDYKNSYGKQQTVPLGR
jgi:hypothetical protein